LASPITARRTPTPDPVGPAVIDRPALDETTSDVVAPADATPDPAATVGASPPAGPSSRLRAQRVVSRSTRRSIALVAFFAAWEIIPRLDLVDTTFVPPFSSVVQAWWKLVANGQLLDHVQASLQRALLGFGLAVLVGVPLGLLIGWYKNVAEVLNPLLELFRNTAALALLPVFVLILGLGETSKVALVVYACLWPVLLNTISGVRGVDPLLIKAARSMALAPRALFAKVILPAALPTIFTGVRLAGAYSILILVAAEMVGAKAGLGYLINNSQSNFQIPAMYAGILTISAIGLGFNALLLRLERRFTRWAPSNH
jgi:NitT/TauT family transport system permease protein